MERLKKRWGIESNFQIIIIFFVFAITGSSSVYIAKPFLEFIGLKRELFSTDFLWGGLLYGLLRLLVIFPIYQVLLVCFGWLFGQHKFFWAFEKKMLKRLGLGVLFT